jgi:hypothetical protein
MAKTVILVHPDETIQIPLQILINNCDLFPDNPARVDSPYTLKSQVSLTDFREFVSALKDSAVIIKKDNFRGLSQLCEEFGFGDLSSQLSQFRDSDDLRDEMSIERTTARIFIAMTEINQSGEFFDDAFGFTAKGCTFQCSVGQAVGLSRAVAEQLSVDACARTFALRDARSVHSIRSLLLGDAVSIVRSQTNL